ncbi:DUF1993 domain-containing protein [Cupriavidus necator]|uniref:DUF1993 domain-containing protein n=1 Tax=Cupriavidus necator TaxID=106590 RepID=UPI0039C32BC9
MYYAAIQQATQSVENLYALLDKAERYAQAQNFPVSELMASRLALDMQPFVYQVQSACDYLKGAAACLSGQTPPKHEDNEQTIDEVRARIRKTIEFCRGVTAEQYQHAAEQHVRLSWAPGKYLEGQDYLLQMTIPNLYFHLTVAYAILRHRGIDVGKMDFLGPISFIDG